ncbi:MAG: YggS family pyridoxal phosphate-dependent enzyme [Synergistetes bacterium]|nr:YggS family pyridoxal phosphate-dependent enzyme [Synergistota bacterium]MCX8127186.1 YggS family pyridoxal phosphate-dependent enzyme [Synergistota bacterium]MDW8191928.1 YggS family pyridoxal phosphate-dependent enzyme [Synergistota bacterium]
MVDVKSRVESVLERINRVCERVGRSYEEVKLVAVSKTFPPEAVREAFFAGIRLVGENKVQEALEKYEALKDLDIKWHMVGYLQRNKVKKALKIFDFIQSLDRLSLAEEIDKEAKRMGIGKVKVLVEVNISGEPTKHGVKPEELLEFINSLSSFGSIDVRGLMTIGPLTEDREKIRKSFRKMKELFDKVRQEFPSLNWEYLSMGMTDDFEIAIEEGSNMVRIGRAIFGPRSD